MAARRRRMSDVEVAVAASREEARLAGRLPAPTITPEQARQYVRCFERNAPKVGRRAAHGACLAAALDEPAGYAVMSARGMVVSHARSLEGAHRATRRSNMAGTSVGRLQLLVVRLDDPQFGAGPGTVVAHVRDASEFESMVRLRDGARDRTLRLWRGTADVGERVGLSASSAGSGNIRPMASNRAGGESMVVANTIAAQLGGTGRLSSMIGAHNFVGGADSLTFRFRARAKNGANALRVVLEPSDTYRVEFIAIRGTRVRTVGSHEGVHAEDLRRLFEGETGLYLSL